VTLHFGEDAPLLETGTQHDDVVLPLIGYCVDRVLAYAKKTPATSRI
jgi:hypothetical protein